MVQRERERKKSCFFSSLSLQQKRMFRAYTNEALKICVHCCFEYFKMQIQKQKEEKSEIKKLQKNSLQIIYTKKLLQARFFLYKISMYNRLFGAFIWYVVKA